MPARLEPLFSWIASWSDAGFLRNVSVLTIGNIVAHLITFLSTPIITRLYSPEEFGVFHLFVGVYSVCSIFVTLRLEDTFLLPKETGIFARLVQASIFSVIAFNCCFIILISISPAVVFQWLGLTSIEHVLYLAVFCILVAGFVALSTPYFVRLKRYKTVSSIRIFQSVSVALCAIIYGVMSVEDGLIYGQFTAFFLLILWLGYLYLSTAPSPDGHQLKQSFARYRYLIPVRVPTAVLDSLSLTLPIFLMTSFYGSDQAGFFALAWKMSAAPIILVGAAFAQVFFQRFSTAWPDRPKAKKLLVNSWLLLGALGVIPCLILFLFGPFIFAFLFGAEWIEAGYISAQIVPLIFFMLVFSPTSHCFIAMDHASYLLIYAILSCVAKGLCFVYALNGASLEAVIYLLVWSEVIILICLYAMALGLVSRSENTA